MKNLLLTALVLLLAFAGFSYLSSSWSRTSFEGEVDSLLRVAKDLTPETAPGLLINKAEQHGIRLLEEDVVFESRRTDVITQTSEKLEKSGLRPITYTATLTFTYTQPFLGISRAFSYSKSRNFTRSVEIPVPDPGEIDRLDTPSP